MRQIFTDNYFEMKQLTVAPEDDLLTAILKEQNRNRLDQNRYFLEYLPANILAEYDFNDKGSTEKFRDLRLRIESPLKLMGGCNLNPIDLKREIIYGGIKMSDPDGNIYGSFDMRNGQIIYSPLFPRFYEERDLCKFAMDTYFTIMTFEEIMREQIDKTTSFYVHVGNYKTIKEIAKNGDYILKKVDKNQMLDFITNPDEGAKIYYKTLKRI